MPVIPPQGQRLRVVIGSDAKNEIDDQYDKLEERYGTNFEAK